MKKKIDTTRDKIDFGSGKIGPLFRRMFFPTLVGMIFMSMLHEDGVAAFAIVCYLFPIIFSGAIFSTRKMAKETSKHN